jgi:hypothetical protein
MGACAIVATLFVQDGSVPKETRHMVERNHRFLRAHGLAVAFILVAALGPVLAQQPPSAEAPAPKPPGVKRIGVSMSGSAAATVGDELIRLLHGDGTVIEAVPLTSSLEAFRIAEAKRKECDFVLDATFEARAKKSSSFLSGAIQTMRELNKDSVDLGNTVAARDETDRKAASVDKMAARLTPEPKDKVRVAYRLTATGASAPLLTNDKEVVASDVPSFLQKFLNDVVMSAMK